MQKIKNINIFLWRIYGKSRFIKTHGTKGFGIECAVIKDEIKNLNTKLATKWKT
jgi:hypothetical protein